MKRKVLSLFFLLLSTLIIGLPFKVIEENNNFLVVEFELKDYEIKKIPNTSYSKILGKFDGVLEKDGDPLLPYFVGRVGIPNDGKISISILDKKTEIISDFTPEPAKNVNSEDDYDFKINNNIYNYSDVYPKKNVEIGEIGNISNRTFQIFKINPFQFSGKRKNLSVINYLKLRINISGSKRSDNSYLENFADSFGENFFLNDTSSKKWKHKIEKAEYVPSNRSEVIRELKFIVDEKGIYKIKYSDLVDSLSVWNDSLDVFFDLDFRNVDPRYLELYGENGEIPIYIEGEQDGSFDNGDYIEFYGDRHYGDEKYYDEYTSENTYFLRKSTEFGARMVSENGGLVESDPSNYDIPFSFLTKKHFERQNNKSNLGWRPTMVNEGKIEKAFIEDIWFWDSIDAPYIKQIPFSLEHPTQIGNNFFNITANFFGSSFDKYSTYDDHHIVIGISNTGIAAEARWEDQSSVNLTGSDFNSKLVNGEHNLIITAPGDTGAQIDQTILNYFDIEYWRDYETDNDYLEFSKPIDENGGIFQFEIENFSSTDISVYKIGTSKFENVQFEAFSENGGAPFTLKFQDEVFDDNTKFIALSEEQKKKPIKILPNFPSDLKASDNSAEHLIIAPEIFRDSEALVSLKQFHSQNGVSTKIVVAQDIYDEFNSGIRSAEAIKDFLTYAYLNWNTPQLNSVVLIGDGLLDERDWSYNRDVNLIPFKNVWTYKIGVTPSDSWYGCLVGDDWIPEISIGRLPVWEEEQISGVVDKIIEYSENRKYDELWHSNVTLASGGKSGDAYDIFARQSENIREQIPENYLVNRVYTYTESPTPPEYQGGTFSLKDNIDNGTNYLQFMGHGGGNQWADYNLFNISDVNTLTNECLPIVTSLSCYGSAFETAKIGCIGESLILEPGKGAICQFGFSGLGYLNSDLYWGYAVVDAIFQKKLNSLGDIFRYTLARFNSTQSGYSKLALTAGAVLLGDPAVRIYQPEDEVEISLDKYNCEIGDTINVSVSFEESFLMAKTVISDENEIPLNIPYATPISNGEYSFQYIVKSDDEDIFKRFVKVVAFNDEEEIIGMTNFTVGKSVVADVKINPENPLPFEEVTVSANFFDEDGIESVYCMPDSLEMIYNDEIGKYIIEQPLKAPVGGNFLRYNFVVKDLNGEFTESKQFEHQIIVPDLEISEVSINKDEMKFGLLIRNIQNSISENTNLRMYKVTNEKDRKSEMVELLSEVAIPEIEPQNSFLAEFDIVTVEDSLLLKFYVNEDSTFIEGNYENNMEYFDLEFDFFTVKDQEVEYATADSNLIVTFEEDTFDSETFFHISYADTLEANNQPGIEPVLLKNELFSRIGSRDNAKYYKIDCLNKDNLVDSLGHFPNDKSLKLEFSYNQTDSLTQFLEDEEEFHVYRWNEKYRKWLKQNSAIFVENDFVVSEVDRIGTYAVFHRTDIENPIISINVADQQFDSEGYSENIEYSGLVSVNGKISLILEDNNGIDVIDQDIDVYLENEMIEESDYSISYSEDDINSIPINYQLDLDEGIYTLEIFCSDVNGNSSSKQMKFRVLQDFDIKNVANYPNPVKSVTNASGYEGRTRFTYVLTDNADEVKIKVYTVSGRLVKTFNNVPASIGYHEYPRIGSAWDCKDEDGFYLANGVYFYEIIAKKSGKTIKKINKMAILK